MKRDLEPRPGAPKTHFDPETARRWAESQGLAEQTEPGELRSVGVDVQGRSQQLTPLCAERWLEMQRAAREDHVTLELVSGFRSVEAQRHIFERKLASGQPLEEILRVNAAPGYSEHHSGEALDLGTPGCEPLCEAFEDTPAFGWLQQHAGRFGFRLSYPRDHPSGIVYEPWHWALAER